MSRAFQTPTRYSAVVALLFLVIVGGKEATGQQVAVRFGKLITEAGPVIEDGIVIIDGNQITSAGGPDLRIPPNARVVDLRPLTGMPGLIDVHVHMTFYWDRSMRARPWDQLGTLGSAVTVFLAKENAIRALGNGVTTVRDLGASNGESFAMKELIRRGAMPGPRMFVAGCGLHITDETSAKTVGEREDPCLADGPTGVQRAVRRQIADGADWIKVFGSTGSGNDVTRYETFSFEELKAAIAAAHRAGKKVAVHSYGPEGASDAVKAGADSIEHAVDISDEILDEMAKRGTFYVPTIDHNRYYIEHREEFGFSDQAISNLKEFIEANVATLRRAIRAHVKIAMGSDAIFTAFGENTRELKWFLLAGMRPAEALTAATKGGAELLSEEGKLGVVAPGAFADLIAVEGNPLDDIDAVQHVRWVMVDGRVLVDRRSHSVCAP